MPPDPTAVEYRDVIKQLLEVQSQLFDKSSTYTKLVLGLGYGAFFTMWSGGKQNLRPIELMSSAFLMMVSLLLFIGFEIYQTYFLSRLSMDFARAVNSPDVFGALNEYKNAGAKAQERHFRIWRIVFLATTIPGIMAALILVEAFARSVWRLRN